MARSMKQTLHLHNRIHRTFVAQPVVYGVPWPEGAVHDEGTIAASDENGRQLPAGVTVTNRWGDGSIQWTLLDLSLDFAPSGDRTVTVTAGARPSAAPTHPVCAAKDGDGVTVGNGLVALRLSGTRGALVASWKAGARRVTADNGLDVTFLDEAGTHYSAKAGAHTAAIEHATPVRAVVRIDGKHAADDGREMLDYFLRFEVRAGRKDVKVTYSFRNRELPVPGVNLRSFYIEAAVPDGEKMQRAFTGCNLTRYYTPGLLRVDEDPVIVASDTGDLEKYEAAHKEKGIGLCLVANPEVLHDPADAKPWFMKNPQYRMAVGNRVVLPYLALVGDSGGTLGAIFHMTALHPKELSSKGDRLRFGIWPDWAGMLPVTQGAGRSLEIYIAAVDPGTSDLDIQTMHLSWEADVYGWPAPGPITVAGDLAHISRCRVFGADKLPAYDMEEHPLFEKKVMDTWMGMAYGSLGVTEEILPHQALGFWEYGDNGANNEEMHALPYFQQHLRTGDPVALEMGLATAQHILEVDFVDFSIDRLQNGGMVAHCLHHNDGAVYASHMWFTELLIAYVFTGDVEFKRAALRICENLLSLIDSDHGFMFVTYDHREAGQPMINLTWCYQFNRDPRYLAGCRKIIYEGLMAQVKAHGRMLAATPVGMPMKLVRYGDYASWEGMYWYWEITRDEEVKKFMLSQLEWRLTPKYLAVHAYHRVADYNPAVYAYYMTGDRAWMDRVARFFRAAFRCARWPLGWIHAMYFIKVAFDLGIVTDDDILPQ
jgi:hypothetical protein